MIIKKVQRNSLSVHPINYSLSILERFLLKHELDNVEIASLRSVLGLSNKYCIATGLGVSDYTDWTHLKAENGYSIWKAAVTNFTDDSQNLLWLENGVGRDDVLIPQMLTYLGAASSETKDYYDYLYYYDGSTYSSNHGGAAGDLSSEGGSYQTILEDTNSFMYVGDASTFEGIYLQHKVFGAGVTIEVEYWDGSAWATLGIANNLNDTTLNFTSDGKIYFDAPGDWATTSVNSQSAYWIRISTTSSITREPSCYQIAPLNSIPSLLVRSTSQINNGEWAWAYYSNAVYITVPNTGNTDYDGELWIADGSTAANKQNFFEYNNKYYTRFLLSTWPTLTVNRRGEETFDGTTGAVITHSLGHTNYTVFVTPHGTTALPISIVKANDTVTVYTSAGITSDFDYSIVEG